MTAELGHRERWGWGRLGALLIGFCLPLEGGLQLSMWAPGYPDQATPVRLVTLVVVAGLVIGRMRGRRLVGLAEAPRNMGLALLVGWGWAAVTLIWTPNPQHGIHDLLAIGVALLTACALILLVGYDQRALAAFAAGFLAVGAAQVILALVEVALGFHVSSQFAAGYLQEHGIPSLEAVYGPVAFGTLGNPNDWGGFMLTVLAVLLAPKAYGLQLGRAAQAAAWCLAALGILIGLRALNDARGFRLGAALILGMYLIHRLRLVWAARVVGLILPGALSLYWSLAGFAFNLKGLPWLDGSSEQPGGVSPYPPLVTSSDRLRLELIGKSVQVALRSYGFGQGVGTESALIDSGEIPLNFHNVVAQLLAELGAVVALAFLGYLLVAFTRWAFAPGRGTTADSGAAFAKAGLAVALLLWGATASGVLDSPAYWTLFAVTALIRQPRADAPGPRLASKDVL